MLFCFRLVLVLVVTLPQELFTMALAAVVVQLHQTILVDKEFC